MAESIGSVSVDVIPNAEGFWTRFKEQTRAGAAGAGRDAGKGIKAGIESELRGGVKVRVDADTAAARAQIAALRSSLDKLDSGKGGKGLLTYLLPLAPALIPLAGAAVAGGAALTAMGAAGILAVKGVKTEMAAGTKVGQEFASSISVIKGDLSALESVASSGLLDGFTAAVDATTSKLPELDALVAASSKSLGDIGGKVIGGIAGGVGNFAPVIAEVLDYVDKLAGKFESWASGPGGAKFADGLATTFEEVAPVLADLAQTAVQLIAAFAPSGSGALSEIDLFSQLVNAMPVDVLKLATTAYIAFRTAVAVTAGIKAATVALEGFAAAETTAAAATGIRGLAGGLATGLARFAPYIAGAVAADFAIQSLVKTNNSWAQSNNKVASVVGNIGTELSDLAHFKIGSFLTGSDVQKNLDARDLRNSINAAIDVFSTIQDETAKFLGPAGLEKLLPYATKNLHTITAAAQTLYTQLGTGHVPLSQAATGFNDLNKSLSTAASGEQDWLTQGKKTGNQINGIAVYTDTWKQAMDEANGSQAGAVAIIKSHIKALGDDQTTIAGNADEQAALNSAVAAAQTKYKLTTDQVDLYASALGITAQQLGDGTVSQQEFMRQIGLLGKVVGNGSTALTGWINAITTFNSGADTAASRGQLIGEALRAANGDAISYANTMVGAAQANQQFVTDLADVKKGVIDWKAGVIDFHNAAAAPLLKDLQGMQDGAVQAAAAVYQHETALGKASAASDAFKTYVNDTSGALKDELTQMGYTEPQAKKLADQYFNIKNSGDLKKRIELLGKDDVSQTLKDILADLDILAGKKILIPPPVPPSTKPVTDFVATVNSILGGIKAPKIPEVGGGTPSTGGGLIPTKTNKATGGYITGPGTGTSDSILARLSNGEYVINARQTAKHLGLLNAINNSLPGFESGGFVGVDYRSSAQKKADKKATSAIKVTVDASDLTSFLRSLPTFVSTAATAVSDQFHDLITKVSQAGGGKSLVSRLRKENKDLVGLVRERERTETRLSAAQDKLAKITDQYNQARTDTRNTILGTFNISTAGQSADQTIRNGFANGVSGVSTFTTTTKAGAISASSILDELKGKVADARKFQSDIGALEKRGLSNAFLQQFIDAGPDALPQLEALMHASAGQLSSLNANEKQLGSIGSALGKNVADRFYGAGVDAAQGLVNGLKSKDKALTDALDSLADRMVSQIRKRLKIHSPSQVFHELGAYTGQGLVNGMVSQLPAVRNAAALMANHAVPNSQAARWGGATGTGGPLVQQNIHAAPGQSPFEIGSIAANQAVFALRSR